jgi:hypothetical protein
MNDMNKNLNFEDQMKGGLNIKNFKTAQPWFREGSGVAGMGGKSDSGIAQSNKKQDWGQFYKTF